MAETVAQITQIQLELDQAVKQDGSRLQLETDITQTQEELEKTKTDLAQVQQALTAAQKGAVTRAYRSRYESMKDECAQLDDRIGMIHEDYPEGFPAISELSDAETAADRFVTLQEQWAQLPPPEPLPAELACFENREPTPEELEACSKDCDHFAAAQRKLHDEQSALAAQMREYEMLTLQQPKVAGAVAGWIVAVLGTGGGIALLILRQTLFASVVLGIGIAAAIVTIAILFARKKYRNRYAQQRAELNRSIENTQQRIALIRRNSEQFCKKIQLFLAEFGISVPPQEFSAGLSRLAQRCQQYREKKKHQLRYTQLQEEMRRCCEELEAYFARYGQNAAGDYRTKLRRMRDDMQELRLLQQRREQLSEPLAQLEQECAALPQDSCPTDADIEALKLREETLRNTQTELTEKLLHQKQQARLLQEKTEQIPQLRDELARAQSELTEMREKVRIFDETMEILQQARQNLSTAYLGTIRSRFEGYLAQLQETTGEKTFIDTELQVQLERMGQARELAYFSAGQTDLVMLCMHLALVDALFKEEPVFVILDDPFVNLDDERTAQALKLLEALSQRRQILYMTCHSSRGV